MKPLSLWQSLEDAVKVIRRKIAWPPEIAIVLGTGLGNLARRVKAEAVFPYSKIPHFPVPTVESHKGELVLGRLGGKKVAVLEGRFHVYEGHTMQEVVFPIRVLAKLGAKVLIVTNAAGGLNLNFGKGELVLIEDHINLMGTSPLVGPNEERLGPRFPDLSRLYSERLIGLTEKAAREKRLKVGRGVYVGVTGPNLETRAEYRFLRGIGGDLVGMSTVPEVLAAVHLGLEILGIAVVTDVCDPDHLEPVDIKEIIRVAGESGPRLDQLIEAVIKNL
jgi:purine-nucleoside phosphorylase